MYNTRNLTLGNESNQTSQTSTSSCYEPRPVEAPKCYVYGPALPPPNNREQNLKAKVYGPTLPSHMTNVALEVSLQKNLTTNSDQDETQNLIDVIPNDEANTQILEDECYGPLPPNIISQSEAHIALEERALQIKLDQLQKGKQDHATREEWMLELPEIHSKHLALGPRQFRTNPGPDLSDRSSWTSVPSDKVVRKPAAHESLPDLKDKARKRAQEQYDKEQEVIVKKHKKHKKQKSLLEIHQSNLKKQKKEENSVRRPFNREIDLKVNHFDNAQKEAILKKLSCWMIDFLRLKMSKEEDKQEIPDIIHDAITKTSYKKGRFLGRGGFAKCYEITDLHRSYLYAGKVVSKKLMAKQSQREKMTQEIKIHQSLKHKHIVGFYNFFEDQFNIYIVLELCRRRSMMELHKRRKAITEPETRFYMRQILSGVQYLHNNNIIHRDLKLGNLFLNDDLHVKIGDFGLAAKIEFDGERKKTLCGTPNYIAPEILNKKGHSFEVDIWSIGCIMYTLLIGRPPFETNSLKETYSRIKKCEYRLTSNISSSAKHMIMLMLQSDPARRPKVQQLAQQDFMANGYIPNSLPVSCLTMAPRFDQVEKSMRKPLIEVTNGEQMITDSPLKTGMEAAGSTAIPHAPPITAFDANENLLTLRKMLQDVIKSKPARNCKFGDEMSDPAAQPLFWVSKWVDYSDKYGFGYQLCDESVGVMFNDTTKLILLPNGLNVHYIDKNGEESYMTVENYPKMHDKKMKLLSYFSRYMREHLLKAGGSAVRENDSLSRIPHLYQWCRSTSGVLMQLNNGTVQMNFGDHTKIMMCPLMAAISYIDEDKSFRTFRFSSIEMNGCSMGLYEKMRYAYDKLGVLLEQEMCEK